jgi:hypothetical protein
VTFTIAPLWALISSLLLHIGFLFLFPRCTHPRIIFILFLSFWLIFFFLFIFYLRSIYIAYFRVSHPLSSLDTAEDPPSPSGPAALSSLLLYLLQLFRRRHTHHSDDEGSKLLRTSVNIYQTTRCNIPEDSHIQIRRRENLNLTKLCIIMVQVVHDRLLKLY